MYECKYFRVIPAQLVINRETDKPDVPKTIYVESIVDEPLYVEAISSKHHLVSAKKSCGIIQPGEVISINVIPLVKAFQLRTPESLYVSILVGNAKVDVTVKIVD